MISDAFKPLNENTVLNLTPSECEELEALAQEGSDR
jgi:hypothetical protein